MKNKNLLLDISSILLGNSLVAFGLAAFTIPNNIAPGGLSGAATAIAHITNMPVGVLMLILNIPLFTAAFFKLGIRPVFKTLISTILLSILIDVFSYCSFIYSSDKLLSSLISGVLLGSGIGMQLSRGISSGGTDFLALVLSKRLSVISSGKLLMAIDGVIIIFAALIFNNIDVLLYSIITVFVSGKVIDAIQSGLDNAKLIYIVTEKGDEILHVLSDEMGMGVTVFSAQGGFTKKSKSVLMTAAHRRDVGVALRAAKQIDKEAFIILTNASEIHGEGFKEL